MASAIQKALLMGRCVPCIKKNASKIVVRRWEMDPNLLAVCSRALIFRSK